MVQLALRIKSVNLRNYMVRGQIIVPYFIVPPKKPKRSETLMSLLMAF